MRVDERGMALPLALLAMVVLGALVATGLAAALVEHRAGLNTLYAVQAAGASELGAAEVVGGWDGYGLDALAPGDSMDLPPVRLAGGVDYEPTVTRLNAELFKLRVRGITRDAGRGALARRQLSLILRRSESAGPAAPPVGPIRFRAWSRPPP